MNESGGAGETGKGKEGGVDEVLVFEDLHLK
jgi:hypothetical protein